MVDDVTFSNFYIVSRISLLPQNGQVLTLSQFPETKKKKKEKKNIQQHKNKNPYGKKIP